MKTAVTLMTIALGGAGIAALPDPVSAQSSRATKVDMKAPAPRLPNGKPDFSGVWARPAARDMTQSSTNANGTSVKGEPNPLPLTRWGQTQWDNYNPVKNGDFAGSCMPFGWIRSFHPHPMQIVQNDEWIAFLFEQSTMFQVVNTEGLPHRQEWPPTWFGDSRGRWEGDKLVIEVVNFNGHATLGTVGHPASDRARLTMTFERPDMGRILFTWVLEDPKTYTRPIRNERVFVLTPSVELMEYACMENNLQSLLDGAITPWVGPIDHAASVVPERWEWTSFDLTKSQTYTGVVKELTWEIDKIATAKMEIGGKAYDVMLGLPVRMDFRGIAREDVAPGTTLTFQGVPGKGNPNDLRIETLTVGKVTRDMR